MPITYYIRVRARMCTPYIIYSHPGGKKYFKSYLVFKTSFIILKDYIQNTIKQD